jgi:hypothetical protein
MVKKRVVGLGNDNLMGKIECRKILQMFVIMNSTLKTKMLMGATGGKSLGIQSKCEFILGIDGYCS